MSEPVYASLFGDRGAPADRWRWLGALGLAACLVLLEVTAGRDAERDALNGLRPYTGTDWALKRYYTRAAGVPIPPKPPGVKRVLYLSNSHARTGGHVARHLQRLLDAAAPGGFEVLDMSDPGIFAPEMLQRFEMALDYDVDVAIVSVAYISFADRMGLDNQSKTVRSFFKPGVLDRLDWGFWARNYAVGVYGETLVARWVRLYCYRNAIRDAWEEPMARVLGGLGGPSRVRFLDADENQSWKFPTGFDRNLFDWSLYALGRDHQIEDMHQLVLAAQRARVPLLGFNLPIDWSKEPRRRNDADIAQYRVQVARAFAHAAGYVDYQDIFPKEFTTYDALHPTWYGARLHALDLALRLAQVSALADKLAPRALLAQFREQGEEDGRAYPRAIRNYSAAATRPVGFRRYDYSDPGNAADLLERVARSRPGDPRVTDYLLNLAWRLRYWLEAPFDYHAAMQGFPRGFDGALESEISHARSSAREFERALEELRQQQLKPFPIPSLPERLPAPPAGTVERLPIEQTDRRSVSALLMGPATRPFAVVVQGGAAGASYTRVDILGDGSFIALLPLGAGIPIPQWVSGGPPTSGWGI